MAATRLYPLPRRLPRQRGRAGFLSSAGDCRSLVEFISTETGAVQHRFGSFEPAWLDSCPSECAVAPSREDGLNAESLISPSAVRAIIGGDCGDPFAHLGMHRRPGGVVVGAFVPEAARVTVVPVN